MSNRALYRTVFVFLLVNLGSPLSQAETKTLDMHTLLRALTTAPNTAAIATQQGFTLKEIQLGDSTARPQAGDSVTALVELGTFSGKKPASQWLIRLQQTARKSASTPADKTASTTLYVNTGEQFTFRSELSGMNLETLGPIKSDTKPEQPMQVRHQAIVVPTDFLALDLYRTALVIARMSKIPQSSLVRTSSNPFSTEELVTGRTAQAALNLTTEEQRSLAGNLPAMMEFLNIVRSTPDLQDILFQILDKPSLIDVFRSGANSSLNFDWLGYSMPEDQDTFWPEDKHAPFGLLTVNIVVFKKPVLTVVLFVTKPRPPLQVSAGILGLVAFKPKPDMKDKFLTVRVLSASCGPSPATPTTNP